MNLNELLAGQQLETLDSEVIDGLRELGGEDDPGLVFELIEMFLDDAPKRLEEMTQGLDGLDYTLMQRAAHTLKSSAANMGVMVLSHVAREMEKAARGEDRETYQQMVDACVEAYAESERALRGVA